VIYGANMVDEINQGQLGDCYFLAGLAAIGEWKQRLAGSFLTNTTNPGGVFAVRVYIAGVPTVVTVDDQLPYDPTYGWL
jgi:calpain-15